MPLRNDDSIEREPHHQGSTPKRDPSEGKAERVLQREARRSDRHGDSIHDEPAIFPGQDGQPIDRDWTCSHCGYNLRGLTTGHPCPECGHVEVYYPPPEDALDSYGRWLARQQADVTVRRSWRAIVVASLISGPLAVLGAFMNPPQGGWLVVVLFGPVLEEVMKIAAISWIIEVRPFLVRSRQQILFVALASGMMFGVIENLLYLNVYIRSPSFTVIAWRWLGCTSLHVVCSVIAATGLVRVWQKTVDEGRRPELGRALPFLIAAAVLHGTYNATALGLQLTGWFF